MIQAPLKQFQISVTYYPGSLIPESRLLRIPNLLNRIQGLDFISKKELYQRTLGLLKISCATMSHAPGMLMGSDI